MSKNKRTVSNIRFSIEVEVEYPDKKDSQKLIDKHRVIRGWEIDSDFSLDNGAEYRPRKKNKLYWNEDSIDQIKEIIGLIKAHRGKIKTGKEVGTHVHIDMSKFSNQEIANIIKAFIKRQRFIYKKFNVYKKREDYCQKIPKEVSKLVTESMVKTIKTEGCQRECHDYFDNRHYGLNILALNKHGSLEFRIFNGSIQINTIKRYIKFAIQFCLKNAKG